MKISAETVEVLEEWFEDIRTNYSGRGMFGATCFGIVTDMNPFEIMRAFNEIEDEHEGNVSIIELLDVLTETNPRQDSMGLSTVYYWPGVEVVD